MALAILACLISHTNFKVNLSTSEKKKKQQLVGDKLIYIGSLHFLNLLLCFSCVLLSIPWAGFATVCLFSSIL